MKPDKICIYGISSYTRYLQNYLSNIAETIIVSGNLDDLMEEINTADVLINTWDSTQQQLTLAKRWWDENQSQKKLLINLNWIEWDKEFDEVVNNESFIEMIDDKRKLDYWSNQQRNKAARVLSISPMILDSYPIHVKQYNRVKESLTDDKLSEIVIRQIADQDLDKPLFYYS